MKKIAIYPLGFGMAFLFVVIGGIMIVPFPVIVIGLFVFKSPDLSPLHIIVGLGVAIAGAYFIYQFFFNSKVVFDNDRFIYNSGGANKTWYPAINVDCKELVDFEWTYAISFTKSNGKKIVFGSVRFSRKQLMRILKEIQTRGGLQEMDIDRKASSRTRNKKCKK